MEVGLIEAIKANYARYSTVIFAAVERATDLPSVLSRLVASYAQLTTDEHVLASVGSSLVRQSQRGCFVSPPFEMEYMTVAGIASERRYLMFTVGRADDNTPTFAITIEPQCFGSYRISGPIAGLLGMNDMAIVLCILEALDRAVAIRHITYIREPKKVERALIELGAQYAQLAQPQCAWKCALL